MRKAFAILFLFWLKPVFSQQSYSLKIIGSDKPQEFFSKFLPSKTTFKDSISPRKELKSLLTTLRNKGYMTCSIDSSRKDSNAITGFIFVGEKFKELHLSNSNVDEATLSLAGLRSLKSEEKIVAIENIELFKQKAIYNFENSGYPFASVALDSFINNNGTIHAKLFMDKHDLIRYDTLQVQGGAKVKRVFLMNYLGIKRKKPYNESTVKKITQRLNELRFVEIIKPHTIQFNPEKATVNLYLKDKKASQFDFILGLLPGGSTGPKITVTGEILLHLISSFGMGEDINIHWQKLQPKTQKLDLGLTYPYLLGLPLGVNFKFQLYKRDTSYIDLDIDFGLQYQIIGSNYLKASLKQKRTIVLNTDTAYIQLNRRLPPNVDLSSNEFALEYFIQKLNYRFNPTNGYTLILAGSVGAKNIKKSNSITSLTDETTGGTFAFLYDSTRLRYFQMHLGLAVEKYWKLRKRSTIKTSFDGKYFYSPQIFENEKYRIGGIHTLRGFDDESIFTPYYALANFEYRYLLSKNSYFYTFFNAALVKDSRLNYRLLDYPFGFGLGVALDTKIGIFGLSYALGRQLDNKIDFKSGKIHFGYVNYF